MIFDLGNEAYSDGPIEPNDDQFKEKEKRKFVQMAAFSRMLNHFYNSVESFLHTLFF